MPYYLYQSKNGEIKEILQKMSEEHVYIENGEKWARIFSIPTASIDTKFNAFSDRDFVEKSKKKNMSVGSMWDESKIQSEKRANILGKDPIKEKAENDYTKKTTKKHPLRNV